MERGVSDVPAVPWSSTFEVHSEGVPGGEFDDYYAPLLGPPRGEPFTIFSFGSYSTVFVSELWGDRTRDKHFDYFRPFLCLNMCCFASLPNFASLGGRIATGIPSGFSTLEVVPSLAGPFLG